VKKNRIFNGEQVKRFRQNPYLIADRVIDVDLSVRIVRQGN
jgi:hypothetical protein